MGYHIDYPPTPAGEIKRSHLFDEVIALSVPISSGWSPLFNDGLKREGSEIRRVSVRGVKAPPSGQLVIEVDGLAYFKCDQQLLADVYPHSVEIRYAGVIKAASVITIRCSEPCVVLFYCASVIPMENEDGFGQ